MKSRNTSIFTLTAILFILSNPAFAYRQVIDLGTLGRFTSSAASINNRGQIVGSAFGSAGRRACLFDSTGHGANKDLGTFNNSYSDYSVAYSINSSGQIVGLAISPDGGGYNRACLFDSTRPNNNKDLGGFGGDISEARSINNSGQIVGWAMDTSYAEHACLFDSTGNGANKNLGIGRAYSINNAGWIVGNSSAGACLFDSTGNGANKNLGTLPGYSTSTAASINNMYQVVGNAAQDVGYDEWGQMIYYNHACLFDITGNGNNIDLGTLGGANSSAYAINDNGLIVGQAFDSFGNEHACLFDPTGLGNNIDLNTLINPSSGWTLRYADGINDNGWIVGQGINSDGQMHAFLLTPEPATLLLLTLGGLTLRRKR
jgi:probable HAF family extracellular repeat protein